MDIKEQYKFYTDTFTYTDGSPIQLGDFVWINGGTFVVRVVGLKPFPTIISDDGLIERGFDYSANLSDKYLYDITGFHDIEQIHYEGVCLLSKNEVKFIQTIKNKMPKPFQKHFNSYGLTIQFIKNIEYCLDFTWYITLTNEDSEYNFYYDSYKELFRQI